MEGVGSVKSRGAAAVLSCPVPPYAMRSVPEYAGLVKLEEQRYPPGHVSRRTAATSLASRQVTTGLASGRNQP